MAEHILPGFLEFAVPLEMQRKAHLDGETLRRLASEDAEAIGARGDVIQYLAKGTAPATAALIRVLACLALATEGGVTFAGHHWCRDHAQCVKEAS